MTDNATDLRAEIDNLLSESPGGAKLPTPMERRGIAEYVHNELRSFGIDRGEFQFGTDAEVAAAERERLGAAAKSGLATGASAMLTGFQGALAGVIGLGGEDNPARVYWSGQTDFAAEKYRELAEKDRAGELSERDRVWKDYWEAQMDSAGEMARKMEDPTASVLEDAEARADWIEEAFSASDEALARAPESSWAEDLIGAVAGTVSPIAAGLISRNPAVAYGAFMAQGAGGQALDARAQGADLATQKQAFGFGAALGATEMIPFARGLGRLGRMGGGAGASKLKQRIGMVLMQSGEEAIQEGLVQTPLEKVVAQHILEYAEPEEWQQYVKDMWHGATIGGTIGAMFGAAGVGAGAAMQNRRARRQGREADAWLKDREGDPAMLLFGEADRLASKGMPDAQVRDTLTEAYRRATPEQIQHRDSQLRVMAEAAQTGKDKGLAQSIEREVEVMADVVLSRAKEMDTYAKEQQTQQAQATLESVEDAPVDREQDTDPAAGIVQGNVQALERQIEAEREVLRDAVTKGGDIAFAEARLAASKAQLQAAKDAVVRPLGEAAEGAEVSPVEQQLMGLRQSLVDQGIELPEVLVMEAALPLPGQGVYANGKMVVQVTGDGADAARMAKGIFFHELLHGMARVGSPEFKALVRSVRESAPDLAMLFADNYVRNHKASMGVEPRADLKASNPALWEAVMVEEGLANAAENLPGLIEALFTDPDAVQQVARLVAKDRSLGEWLRDFFVRIINRLLGSDIPETKRKRLEKLMGPLYDPALGRMEDIDAAFSLAEALVNAYKGVGKAEVHAEIKRMMAEAKDVASRLLPAAPERPRLPAAPETPLLEEPQAARRRRRPQEAEESFRRLEGEDVDPGQPAPRVEVPGDAAAQESAIPLPEREGQVEVAGRRRPGRRVGERRAEGEPEAAPAPGVTAASGEEVAAEVSTAAAEAEQPVAEAPEPQQVEAPDGVEAQARGDMRFSVSPEWEAAFNAAQPGDEVLPPFTLETRSGPVDVAFERGRGTWMYWEARSGASLAGSGAIAVEDGFAVSKTVTVEPNWRRHGIYRAVQDAVRVVADVRSDVALTGDSEAYYRAIGAELDEESGRYIRPMADAADPDIRQSVAGDGKGKKGLTQTQIEAEEEAESGTVADVEIDETAWAGTDDDRSRESRYSVAPSVGRIPMLSDADLAGKRKFVFFADRMRVGTYTGLFPDDGISIPLQGGAGYPFIKGQRGKAGWAFSDKGMWSRFAKRVDATDGIGIVTLFGSGNVRGNLTFLRAYFAEVEAAIKAGRLSERRFLREANKLRRSTLGSKKVSESSAEWKSLWSPAWKSIQQAEEALAAVPFDVRNTDFFGWNPGKKSGNRGQKIGRDELVGAGRFNGYGFPNISDMVAMMEDPRFEGMPYGTMVAAVEFPQGQAEPTDAAEIGADPHLSYPVVIRGRGLGYLRNPRLVTEVVDSDKELRHALRSASVSMADARFSVAAFHGSPHDIQGGFSTGKIGTGEGAQAYGWGLYFADKQSVARHYKEELSPDGPAIKVGGVSFYSPSPHSSDPMEVALGLLDHAGWLDGTWPLDEIQAVAAGYAEKREADTSAEEEYIRLRDEADVIEKAVESNASLGGMAERSRATALEARGELESRRAVTAALRHLSKSNIEVTEEDGYGYTVRLAPADDEWLLWDRPLSEQSEKVKAATAPLLAPYTAEDAQEDAALLAALGVPPLEGAGQDPRLDWPGLQLYDDLSRRLGSQRAASLALLDAGIRGIKYLDGTSRSKGEGSFNYVVFDDADVEITDRWSVAGDAAVMSEQRVDRAISLTERMGLQGWIAVVDPGDFFAATLPAENREEFERYVGPLDVDRLSGEPETPYLVVTEDAGAPSGWRVDDHEGRHRMVALRNAGVTQAQIRVEVRDPRGGSVGWLPSLTLEGQGKDLEREFADVDAAAGFDPKVVNVSPVLLTNLIPATRENRQAILEQSRALGGSIRYSVAATDGGIIDGTRRGLKGFAQRNFTSRGDLAESTFEAMLRRNSAVSVQNRLIAESHDDFKVAAKEVYGGLDKIPDGEMRKIDQVFKGAAPLEGIPRQMRSPVSRMRQHVDALSRQMIRDGALSKPLKATVARSMGTYATRSYRVFDDPDWAKKVSQEVRNRAHAYITEELTQRARRERKLYAKRAELALLRAKESRMRITSPRTRNPERHIEAAMKHEARAAKFQAHADAVQDPTQEQVDGVIANLLYEGKAADSPIALISQGKLGAKDLSILKKRTGIAPEIRALYGEYEDPLVNYARSVAKMANLLANQRFLENVREAGLREGYLTERPTVENKKKIAADSSSVMAPLNGLYAAPEMIQAFEEAVGREEIPGWLRALLVANGVPKLAKTVLSPITHVRNIVGNVGFATAQGHWRIGSLKHGGAGFLTSLGVMKGKEWRDYYRDALAYGVINESARAGELRDILKETSGRDIDEVAYTQAKSKLDKVLKGTMDLYQSEDDLWKLFAWENEKARYRKAKPEWTEDQVKAKAAEIVRSTYPTYSLVPRGVKLLRRFPFMGTFVSFPAEVVRTTGNTISLIREELADEATRGIAYQRIAGSISAAFLPIAAAAISRALLGISDEEDEAMRQFIAPWSRNSTLIHLGRDDEGRPVYIDTGYTDPFSYLKNPIFALLRGDDPTDAVYGALKEALDPFASEEILVQAVREIVSNKTETGREVYNTADFWDDQAASIAGHLWNATEPGIISSGRRIKRGLAGEVTPYGKEYDPLVESIAVVTGTRMTPIDVEQSLMFRVRDYATATQDANKILSSVASRAGNVSDEAITDAYISAERSRREVYDEALKAVQAARALGLSEDAIRERLKAAGISSRAVRDLMDGVYQPYKPTGSFLKHYERGAASDRRDELRRRRRFVDDLSREARQ